VQRDGALDVLPLRRAPHDPVLNIVRPLSSVWVGQPRTRISANGVKSWAERRTSGVTICSRFGFEHDQVGVAADGDGALARAESEGPRGIRARQLRDPYQP